MNEEHPKRLLESQDTPDALREALRALGGDRPSPEAVGRVQETLDGLAPTTMAKLGIVSVLLPVGAVVGVAILALVSVQRDAPEPDPRTSVGAGATALDAVRMTEGPSRPQPMQDTTTEVSASPVAPAAGRGKRLGVVPTPATRRPALPARPPASGPAGEPPPQAPEAPKAPEATGPQPAPPTRKAAARPIRSAPIAPPQPAESRATRPPDEEASHPSVPEPQDEAGLLYRARRAASRHPREALRLLDTHRFYFPGGALVEEREVLAIELHRRLGHTDEARRLSERFRIQHPDSVYHRVLSP